MHAGIITLILPDWSEFVSSFKQENKKLQHKLKSGSGGGNSGGSGPKKCEKC